jgi:hypothetical protein
VRRRHDVGLDGRLESIDPDAVLDRTHGVEQRALVDHRVHLLVVQHRRLQLVIELVDMSLADADHGRAHTRQGEHERSLVGRKRGFEEDDVHGL